MNEYVFGAICVVIPLIAFGWGVKYFVQKEDYLRDTTEIKSSIKSVDAKLDKYHDKIIDLLTINRK